MNIRVPLGIIRAGMKLRSLIPSDAANRVDEKLKSKGLNMDLRSVKDEDLEQLVEALSELEVDVRDGKEKVPIYVE